ncbi:universal stress protein [Allomuricauda sp. ARW1Y1]|jgi:nucleotide-binding universal stress UspA family protein|uniref:universal stress protein n=1 Tax=Allomuricauda sp. ARW1Y1 TaxID=2663843 RepID=UPI0015CD4F04|nr:universal stress protein [Muricauda sp. ARW1Y1]NYJ27650.1 nucleotide-binding universal stress UspA family protein [Muricauda sp. ARW1Y1]
MKRKRIILPTDFSKNAWNAIVYALTVFKDDPCDFFILNSFQVGASGLSTKMARYNDTRLYNLMKEQSERDLKRELEKISALDKNPNHNFIARSEQATLVNAIGKTVYKEEIDYVIMGTKGVSGLKEVFMGSNTFQIIKEIDFCPIIAVPEDYQTDGELDSLMLATGYEHLFENYELQPLLHLPVNFKAKLRIVYVGNPADLNEAQKKSKEALEKRLDSIEHEFVEVEKDGSVTNTIQKMVQQDDTIDMLVMIHQDHSFFEKLTREPVIKKVAFATRVPFMVVHLFE